MYLDSNNHNILLGGFVGAGANSYFTTTDSLDGVIIRLSSTAAVEWFVKLGFGKSQYETVQSLTMNNNFVYAFVLNTQANPDRPTALLKLTYEEGKV